MRRFVACLLALSVTVFVPACGGSSGIEEGIPKNAQAPPPNFDPGGDAKPDMIGKASRPSP